MNSITHYTKLRKVFINNKKKIYYLTININQTIKLKKLKVFLEHLCEPCSIFYNLFGVLLYNTVGC